MTEIPIIKDKQVETWKHISEVLPAALELLLSGGLEK